MMGATAMAAGLVLSSQGTVWALYVGHGLLIGFFGNGALYAPLMVYVSRWFDRRRGTALALIASGQYIAGMFWPTVLEVGMKRYGWQTTMLAYASWCSRCCRCSPCCVRHRRARDRQGPPRARSSRGVGAGLAARTPSWRCSAWRASCAAYRWRYRPPTWSLSAATWASFPPMAPRCFRSCWPALSFRGSSGAPSPIASAACTRCWPDRRSRR